MCMDQERSCLYVSCNHLAVCVECDADIKAACLPCPMCNTAIDREGSERGGGRGGGVRDRGRVAIKGKAAEKGERETSSQRGSCVLKQPLRGGN